MAAPGTFILTQAARAWLMDGTFDLDTNTVKAALLTSAWTPNMATQILFGDISANEVGTTNTGYTAGGNTMTGTGVSQTGGVGKFTGTIPSWTAGSARSSRLSRLSSATSTRTPRRPGRSLTLPPGERKQRLAVPSARQRPSSASGNRLSVNWTVSFAS